MSGRAVGGAAGAGCGAFSVVGVLLGVGLSVWLGSQVLGGGGSSDEDRQAAELTEQIEDLGGVDGIVPTSGAAGRSLVATPQGPMADGTALAVAGAGLAPGPAELTLCLTHESWTADGLSGCDPTTTVPTEVAPDGRLLARVDVARVLTVGAVPYDCAAFAEACSLVAHPPGDPAAGISAPLAFDEGLPPVDADRPPGG